MNGLFRSRFGILLSLFAVVVLSGCTTYNPATGRSELILISTDQEVAMGADFHKAIDKQFKFSDNRSQVSRLESIGHKIAAHSDRVDYRYSFFLIEKDEMNAFTGPGGRIYMFTKLMNSFKTDDQIASVLAHEIGHCAAKHVVKKYQAALGYNLIGSIASSQIDGGAGSASTVLRGTNTLVSLAFSAYGRQDEYEADRLGIKYMLKAGYDPQGMVEAFKVLEKESKGARVPTLLRSHPHLADRIIKAREEIRQQKRDFITPLGENL